MNTVIDSLAVTIHIFFMIQFTTEMIFMHLHVFRSLDTKNHVFSCLSVCFCFCVSYKSSSEANNGRKGKTDILDLYLMEMLHIHYSTLLGKGKSRKELYTL